MSDPDTKHPANVGSWINTHQKHVPPNFGDLDGLSTVYRCFADATFVGEGQVAGDTPALVESAWQQGPAEGSAVVKPPVLPKAADSSDSLFLV